MSKKIYLLLLTVVTLSFNVKAQVPTCSIDPSFTNEGIWPDSATNFVSGTVGVAYAQNVTIRIPYDTVTSLGTYHYSHVDLQSSSNNYGLPPGLSLTGTPSTFKFPGNASSCMEIYGTPTTAGDYPLKFVLKVYTTETGNSFALTTYTISYYKIHIDAPQSGINTHNGYSFELGQNIPNPVTTSTTIKFTAELEAKIKFSVYNITGQKVIEKEIQAQRGDNSYLVDASSLENGVYIYSLELNGHKQMRRMMVSK